MDPYIIGAQVNVLAKDLAINHIGIIAQCDDKDFILMVPSLGTKIELLNLFYIDTPTFIKKNKIDLIRDFSEKYISERLSKIEDQNKEISQRG